MAKSKRFSADYTADDILGLYRARKSDGDEARLRSVAETMRQMTRLEHQVDVPRQYRGITKEIRTPYIRDSWHRITASLLNKAPVVHIEPKDQARKEYRESANTAERFDLALIERLNRQQGEDTIYNDVAAMVRDGESVLKVVHKPDSWANFPERDPDEEASDYLARGDEYKRGADLPIAWRNVDRLQLVFEDGEFGDGWALEYGEYAKPSIKARYGVVEDPQSGRMVNPRRMLTGHPAPEGELTRGSSGTRTCKVEFWTASEWHVLIDGTEAPGWPKRNPYAPYLPYFRAPSYDRESLLYSLMFLVPGLDSLLTMKQNWAYLGSYPTPVIRTVPGQLLPGLEGIDASDSSASSKLQLVTGKLLELPAGKEISYLVPPPVGSDVNDLIQIYRALIDVAGIPSIFRGSAGGADSGYMANQMLAAANMAFRIASIALQRQHEKALEFIHHIVANVIKQTTYVLGWDEINAKTGKPTSQANRAWLGLSPDSEGKNIANLSKLGQLSLQFRPMLPTDEQARAMIALQLTNAAKPLSSQRHALENYLQEEDPDSILDEMAVEEALNSEPLKSQVMQEALRDAGLLPPAQTSNPATASGLVDLQGNPLMSAGMAGLPGQAQAGMPSVPGVNMPMRPQAPTGGRPAGAYPGQPSNQGG